MAGGLHLDLGWAAASKAHGLVACGLLHHASQPHGVAHGCGRGKERTSLLRTGPQFQLPFKRFKLTFFC